MIFDTNSDTVSWSVLPCTLPACLKERCKPKLNPFPWQVYRSFALSKIQESCKVSVLTSLSFLLLLWQKFWVSLFPIVELRRPNLSCTLFSISWLLHKCRTCCSAVSSQLLVPPCWSLNWGVKGEILTFCSQVPWTTWWWSSALSRFLISSQQLLMFRCPSLLLAGHTKLLDKTWLQQGAARESQESQ